MDLVPLLGEAVEEAAAVGAARSIRVRLQGAPAAVRVRASAEHLRTLFVNLLVNAVQYSRPDSEVTATLVVDGERVRVSVGDHGIGIAAEDLKRIFSEYYRATAAVRHHQDGDGLGLAIVKAIVGLLGAEIDVVSEVGQGTVFTVTFAGCTEKDGRSASTRGGDNGENIDY